MEEKSTQEKLIVLYIISKLNKAITNLQMTDLILSSTSVDYFTLQDLLIQLQNDKFIDVFIEEEQRYYKITEQGEILLKSLINMVPVFVISRIEDEIKDAKKEVNQKSVVTADFFPDGKNNFLVKCKISEGGKQLVKISLNAPTREKAIEICNKWYENPSKYYLEIINIFEEKE